MINLFHAWNYSWPHSSPNILGMFYWISIYLKTSILVNKETYLIIVQILRIFKVKLSWLNWGFSLITVYRFTNFYIWKWFLNGIHFNDVIKILTLHQNSIFEILCYTIVIMYNIMICWWPKPSDVFYDWLILSIKLLPTWFDPKWGFSPANPDKW